MKTEDTEVPGAKARKVKARSSRQGQKHVRCKPNYGFCSAGLLSGLLPIRDVREWLSTFPFPPIPIYSIPIPSHPHSQVFDLFPFPWDSRVVWAIPIPSHSHSVNAKVVTCLLLRDVVMMRLFLRPIAARLLKCPSFVGIVILMTFVATLRIYGIATPICRSNIPN